MDDMQQAILQDKYRLYLDSAEKAKKEGRYRQAKQAYSLAAQTLLKMAEISTTELRRARVAHVKEIMRLAEEMGKKDVPAPSHASPAGGQGQSASSEEGDEPAFKAAEIPDVRFSDVAGLEDVKKAITTRMINPLRYPEQYAAYGKKTGGGVLLYGPPGTGKTMIARAIAGEVGAAFFAVKGSDIVSKWVGDSEKNIHALFETARAQPLSIIFIDEMDSLLGERGVDTHNDKRVNEFLQEMDGFMGRCPNLLLLGATNLPWKVDSAAMRSGRFSQKIYVPLPDAPARRFLFEKFLGTAPLAPDVSVDELVRLSDGYSGADIEEVCDRAKEDPLYRAINMHQTVPLSMEDFRKAFISVPPSVNPRMVAQYEAYAGKELGMKVTRSAPQAPAETPSAPEPPEAPSVPQTSKAPAVPESPETPVAPTVSAPSPAPAGPGAPTSPVAPSDEKTEDTSEPEDAVLQGGPLDDGGFTFTWDQIPSVTFDDVAGLEEVKEAVRVKVLLPLSHPEAFVGYKKKSGGGLLLYGPPGTGKTMIAAAIAHEIGAKFCSVKPSDVLHQGAGNSEKAVRALFMQARRFPCAVIYFDEMESITPKDTRSQYAKQLRSELLAQLQGMDSYTPAKGESHLLFLIAATNKPWEMDSAFVRPGRFGTRIYVGLPDEAARLAMIEKRLSAIRKMGVVTVMGDINTEELVALTNGFNGSDISNLLDRAEECSIVRGMQSGIKVLSRDDFATALQTVHSSVQKDDIEKLRQWRDQVANS